jgi:ABC-type multidrug transport system ATPase subunit
MKETIRMEGLTRKFNTLVAVDNLHMSVRQGEIYGFLGSNGAGKTTTIKMLVGLLQPDTGHAWIAGHDVWTEPLAAKTAFGYVADRSILYERLTGREFLAFLGQVRGLPQAEVEKRIEYLLDTTELTGHADRLCGSYSFGLKRKLSLAGALLHQPQVLILNEPLNGLDPRSARRLKGLFIELAAGGVTVLLSTHDLATAGAVCHRIAIIHRGRLLAEGSPSELRQVATAADLETVFLSLTSDQQQEPLLSA